MHTPTNAQPAEKNFASTRTEFDREQINALGRIYLEAGLPLAAAFEAALADISQGFDLRERPAS